MDDKLSDEELESISLDADIESAVIQAVQDGFEAERNGQSDDGKLIDWGFWSRLENITPAQAAKLACFIDPIKWPGTTYSNGDIPDCLIKTIQRLEQRFESRHKLWSLSCLVEELGNDAPIRMREAASLDNTALQTVESDAIGLESEVKAEPDLNTAKTDDTDKRWLIPNPQDPEPEQPWYVAARYFARELVKADSTLLIKRKLLAGKVSQSLANAGIYKRGGKKPPSAETVLKAFSNIKLG